MGSTGSIGKNTLEVVAGLPGRLHLAGICAHKNVEAVVQQARQYNPDIVVVTDPVAAEKISTQDLPRGCQLWKGQDGALRLARSKEVDLVVSAVVGAAGLEGTWAALESGKTIALANKETLVVAGQLVMELAQKNNTAILPVDSEHSAIFQALQGSAKDAVEKVILTGSGGPFRGLKAAQLQQVTPEQALRHPTWKMGPKITIDSATLMNKALELIEARWLFALKAEQIGVILHPESVVHSFVEFRDGSVLAQASPPDMRLPIQYALTYPERLPGPTRRMNWGELRSWNFELPDEETFISLELGREVARRGGTCGAVLNAANETAVASFLAGEMAFLDIALACKKVLEHHDFSPSPALAELQRSDQWARQEVERWKTQKNRMAVSR